MSKILVLPSNKKFGLFFSLVFILLGTYFLLFNKILILSYFFYTLGLIFFLISLIKPSILIILNKLWMKFGHLIGRIVSPIVLGIIFYGIFTPVAIFMRLFGRDELKIRLNKAKSLWVNKKSRIKIKNSFKEQF